MKKNECTYTLLMETMKQSIGLNPKIELANNYGFSQHELNNIRKIVEQYGDDFKESFRRHIGKRIND